MRVGIVVWELLHNMGGVERVGVDLAHAMLRRGHDVTVIVRTSPHAAPAPLYALDPAVSTVVLDVSRDTQATVRRCRAQLQECGIDVLAALFSWRDLIWFPRFLHGTGIPLLVSEHNLVRVIEQERWNRREHWACLAAADVIHILFEGFRADYPEFLHDRIRVIPNAVAPAATVADVVGSADRKVLLAVGRCYEHQKQFSLLMSAFAVLAHVFPEWQLRICGDGQDMPLYRALVERLGLGDRISLPGNVTDVASEYAAAQLFCIPSAYEGFGLVTVEAQSHGLPVVGFSGCAGTNQLVTHGVDGLLAPDMTVESLVVHLRMLMARPELRQNMGKKGILAAMRFDPEGVHGRWEAVFHEALACRGKTRLNIDVECNDKARAATMLRVLLQQNCDD